MLTGDAARLNLGSVCSRSLFLKKDDDRMVWNRMSSKQHFSPKRIKRFGFACNADIKQNTGIRFWIFSQSDEKNAHTSVVCIELEQQRANSSSLAEWRKMGKRRRQKQRTVLYILFLLLFFFLIKCNVSKPWVAGLYVWAVRGWALLYIVFALGLPLAKFCFLATAHWLCSCAEALLCGNVAQNANIGVKIASLLPHQWLILWREQFLGGVTPTCFSSISTALLRTTRSHFTKFNSWRSLIMGKRCLLKALGLWQSHPPCMEGLGVIFDYSGMKNGIKKWKKCFT